MGDDFIYTKINNNEKIYLVSEPKEESLNINNEENKIIKKKKVNSTPSIKISNEDKFDMISIISTLCLVLIETINLYFLGHLNDDLIYMNSYQIGMIIIAVLGNDFTLGSIRAFENLGMLEYNKKQFYTVYKLYHGARIVCIIIFLIWVLPFGYSAIYILYFLGYDDKLALCAGNFVRISLIYIFLNYVNKMNKRLLLIMGHSKLVLIINFITLIFHILSCVIFITAFKMDLIGIALSLIVSAMINFILTSYFVIQNNPFEFLDGSLFLFDTSTIHSNKFYIYLKLAIHFGFHNYIHNLFPNIMILASYFLEQNGYKVSLASNIILLNYFSIMYCFMKGVCLQISKKCFKVINTLTMKKYNLHNEKEQLSQALLLKDNDASLYITRLNYVYLMFCIMISLINFIIDRYFNISCFYINCENTLDYISIIRDNVSFVIKIYCLVIFFDWGYNLILSYLAAINKQTSINISFNLILITLFIPLALLLSFTYKYSYLGFWYSNFASMICFTVISLYIFSNINIDKESLKVYLNYKNEEENEI
jgi:Na+-driven multidrug efflux pump